MTTNIELDSFSGSLNEHSASNEHGDQTSPAEIRVAQANSTQQPAAASEPVPVDVGGGASAKPEAPAEAKAPPAAAPHEYVADASHVVRLPANVSIDNIKVDGHNLVLEQADGSVIVIKDGALNVPTFIIGDVEVPRVALLAALEASHVDVAFGADGSMSAGPGGSNSSAGGDFSVPPGGIGDGFDLSALLPPTALQFGLLDHRELFPSIVDRPVSVTATSLLAPSEAASETGLDGGGAQSPGSDAPSHSETSGNGTISITAPDGIGSIVINGVTVTGVGQEIPGQFGFLTIVSYNPSTGAIEYNYTVTESVTHPNPTNGFDPTDTVPDNFSITVTDVDGDTASTTFAVAIVDDVPTAHNDSGTQASENAAVTVNVFANDVPGADGVAITDPTKVSYVANSLSGAGTLTYHNDGTFTYAPVAGEEGTVTFQYQIIDGDGDSSIATVTINLLKDSTPTIDVTPEGGTPSVDATAVVDERGLPAGTGELADPALNSDHSETTVGTFNISTGGDTLQKLEVMDKNSTLVDVTSGGTVQGVNGVLTVTLSGGVYSYSYTLSNNVANANPNQIGAADQATGENFAVKVTDSDNDTANASLTVKVNDDGPTAATESSQNVAEGATVTGTLDFVAGADGATVTHIGATALVFGGDGYSQPIDIGDGLIKVTVDGHYSFTADNPVIGAGAASATYTVTDGDGDTATAGISFAVTDANVPTTGTAAATVDDDGLAGGNPASTTGDIDANLGEVPFSASEATYNGTLGGSVGGDGAGANGFSFATLNGSVGTVGQESVTYSWDAGNNTLTATGPRGDLFTVHVTDPATGAYTVTLLENVLQAQGPNDENNATVNLGYVITDADGSTAPGTLTITFNDDAPTVTLADVKVPTLSVDESFIPVIGSVGVGGGNVSTGDFGTHFTVTPGADGQSGSTAYSLTITNPDTGLIDSKTGLAVVLVLNGSTVEAHAGAGGPLVFTIAVDATGHVTMTELRGVHEGSGETPDGSEGITLSAGLVSLTATVTDNDSDKATASIDLGPQITIHDDGPLVTAPGASASLTVDETDLTANATASFAAAFMLNFGADGPLDADHNGVADAGAVTYALNISASGADSGLVDTASGNHVFLFLVGGQVVGREGTSAGAAVGGPIVFTVSVSGSNVTLDQVRAVMHADPNNPDDNTTLSTANLVTLTATATDGDGDKASQSLNIGTSLNFHDDAPSVISPETAVLVNVAGSIATFDLDGDANIDNNVGADQLGSISFANIINGQLATGIINGSSVNLTSAGQSIQLFLVDHDSNPATPLQLQGWIGGQGTGTEIFQITLQPDGSLPSSADHYQVQVFAAIGATQQTHIDNFSTLGSNTQQFKALDVAGTTHDVLFSGYERLANGTSNATSGSSVSASTTGIGVANNSMNDGDNLRIDFVNDLTASGGNNNTYNYSTHYDVNSFQFAIVQVNGSPPADSIETWVRIYNAADDNPNSTSAADSAALANDPQLSTITDIKVNGVSVNLASLTTDGHGGYLVTGLDLHDTVLVTASGTGYDRIEIENAIATAPSSLNGESFDIGAFAFVTTVTNVPSVELNFDVALKDADGDTSTSPLVVDLLSSGSATTDHSSSGSLVNETAGAGVDNIIGSNFGDSLTGNGSANVLAGLDGNDTLNGLGGNDLLIGGSGDDTLNGGAGNDILFGGAGHDTMTGGTGADTFKLDNLDLNIKDLIIDYNKGEGDQIDLTALFDKAAGTIDDYVHYDTSTKTLSVDTDGSGNAANFVAVADLQNGPTTAGAITILYDDTAHVQHTVTI
ncbi:putative secreted protein (type I secretion substrate) [Mesorhizobium loti]|uniref:Putative secreted protein (Type I secretion substrate) n=1 Tax=Rhizobium loti TaxID=381 RepID=A0A8E2WH31_RHILI|nr:DUF5801 repeats-in-toxin domain-containing protein [Mesorhizobium loti]PWJ94125.1 putative secreted protein (type I secretion substrate) [Mesorhizobium loti]